MRCLTLVAVLSTTLAMTLAMTLAQPAWAHAGVQSAERARSADPAMADPELRAETGARVGELRVAGWNDRFSRRGLNTRYNRGGINTRVNRSGFNFRGVNEGGYNSGGINTRFNTNGISNSGMDNAYPDARPVSGGLVATGVDEGVLVEEGQAVDEGKPVEDETAGPAQAQETSGFLPREIVNPFYTGQGN